MTRPVDPAPPPATSPVATCTVTIDGRRRTIRPHTRDDTVADLASALGAAPSALTIDGVWAPPDRTLVEAGLCVGSSIVIPHSDEYPPSSPPVSTPPVGVSVELAVAAGPCCRPWRPLPPGRHTVGRAASADVRLDDAEVELHHGIIDVAGDGTVTFTQLTGRIPVRLDGEPGEPCQDVTPGQALLIGASRLEIRVVTPAAAAHRGTGSVVPFDRDPWRHVVRRGPARPSEDPPAEIAVPAAPAAHSTPSMVGLVGAGVAAAGAAVMAAVLGQALFALFAVIGAAASVATWAVGALGARRARRRAARIECRQTDEFVEGLRDAGTWMRRRHVAEHHLVTEMLACDDGGLWERRVDGEHPMRVTIGRGCWRWTVPIAAGDRATLSADLLVAVDRCERLRDVAVPLTLAPSTVMAVHGDDEMITALVRSLIIQLACSSGPADWRLVVVSTRRREWEWTEWLPHTAAAHVVDPHDVSTMAEFGDDRRRPTLVVTDAPAALTARTGPLRRLLDATAAACVVIAGVDATIPAVCGRVLDVGSGGRADWRHHESLDDAAVHVAGISRSVAEAAGRRLAPLVDPEDGDSLAAELPPQVRLGELSGPDAFDPPAIAERWRAAGRDPSLAATVGRSADGTVDVDLVRDGPHGLIAGTTGAGKSELLRTLVVALAAHVGPDHLSFVLVDFKGGATFDTCARLPHVVGVVTDLDHGLAERALVSLDAEVRRRERLLRACGADDLTSFRRRTDEPLPRLVVIVDEFASLAKDLPGFLGSLLTIAQRGRSLGVHLLLATQRPAGVVTDDIRANTNLRLALRLHDRADALDVVGDAVPSTFARAVPGRAALRLGPDELVVFQTASCTSTRTIPTGRLVVEPLDRSERPTAGAPSVDSTELTAIVEAIEEAALIAGVAPAHRPWVDPLPAVLRPCDMEQRSAIGVIDDPAEQRRRPLQWTRVNNLLLVGALGSGTTTTAISVAASFVRGGTPADRHLYVIDGNGEPALDALQELAHCGAVLRPAEHERIDRLLRRLTDDLDRRVLTGTREVDVLLVIDGLPSVRTALAPIDRVDAAARLDRVLQEGPAVGITTCVTTDGSSHGALAAVPGERWVFHVDDPSLALAAGLRAEPPPPIPGRLRVVESDLDAHVALDRDVLRGLPRRDLRGAVGAEDALVGPRRIDVLPAVVDPECLPPAARDVTSGVLLTVGLSADELEVAALELPVGDHVFIGGASRSGRSTALRQVVAAWRETHPAGRVVVVDRGSPLEAGAIGALVGDGGPVLVAIDDAERVGDPHGELAAVLGGHRHGATVAAAARIEAVRSSYGHWIRDVARSRCGLLLTSAGELDGEILGATLPRRTVIAPRAGLAWMIDRHGRRLVQVAARMPS